MTQSVSSIYRIKRGLRNPRMVVDFVTGDETIMSWEVRGKVSQIQMTLAQYTNTND